MPKGRKPKFSPSIQSPSHRRQNLKTEKDVKNVKVVQVAQKKQPLDFEVLSPRTRHGKRKLQAETVCLTEEFHTDDKASNSKPSSRKKPKRDVLKEERNKKERKSNIRLTKEQKTGCSDKYNNDVNEQVSSDLSEKFKQRLEEMRLKNFVACNYSIRPKNDIFQKLCDLYEQHRDPDRAEGMKKYMRNKFEYFGISAPQRRALNKEIWPQMKSLDSSALRTLALETWACKERELQYFTVDLLEKELFRLYSDDKLPATQSYATETLSFVGMFLQSYVDGWWDTVDPLSIGVVGPLVQKYPEELLPLMDEWNLGHNIWLCRASLLYQLKYRSDTDEKRLFKYCLKASNREDAEIFFIHKAIGWALRQHFRTNPDAVRQFVNKNKSKLPKLSVREALKHDK